MDATRIAELLQDDGWRHAPFDGEDGGTGYEHNDSKYGSAFDAVARTTGIEILRTPIKTPRANAIVERDIGSVRRECLDHILIFGERQLYRVIQAYVDYFNRSQPHQDISQNVPCGPPLQSAGPTTGKINSIPTLNGLHHEYRRAV